MNENEITLYMQNISKILYELSYKYDGNYSL
jgi:hypothetical protein